MGLGVGCRDLDSNWARLGIGNLARGGLYRTCTAGLAYLQMKCRRPRRFEETRPQGEVFDAGRWTPEDTHLHGLTDEIQRTAERPDWRLYVRQLAVRGVALEQGDVREIERSA